jgi:hypothetical protein
MKIIFYNLKKLVLTLSVIACISCDEIDELTEVDFNSTFTQEVSVTLSENNASISESLTIRFADNEDVEPYLDQIESISVTSASYTIKDYNGLETATGSIAVNANAEVFGPFQHTFFTDDQNDMVFNFDASRLNVLSSSLSSNNQLSLNINGTQDPAQNASFTVEFTLEVDVTAQALQIIQAT